MAKIPVQFEKLIDFPDTMSEFKEWFHTGNGVFTFMGERAYHIAASVMITAMTHMWDRIGDNFLFVDSTSVFTDDEDIQPLYTTRVVTILQPDRLREVEEFEKFESVMRHRVLSRPKKFTLIALEQPWASHKYSAPREMIDGTVVPL